MLCLHVQSKKSLSANLEAILKKIGIFKNTNVVNCSLYFPHEFPSLYFRIFIKQDKDW